MRFFSYNGVISNKHRGEKGEKKAAGVLERISEPRYVLHDVTLRNLISELTHQLDHILIHPHGLFVIETKNYSGTIIMDEIKRLIESVAVDAPMEERLENIAILCQVRKEAQAEMTYAIELRLCPRCDAPIEEKDYAYHCPKCGYSFRL